MFGVEGSWTLWATCPRVTGVCAVPSLGKVYASVPGHHHIAVIDAATLKHIGVL